MWTLQSGVLLLLLFLLPNLPAAERHPILAVFAHPDDETAVSPLLQFQDQGISTPPEMEKVRARLREILYQVRPAFEGLP